MINGLLSIVRSEGGNLGMHFATYIWIDLLDN